LWELGKHILPISGYVNYISKHPQFIKIDEDLSGIALLEKEYSTLSKAVHASSINFRMTLIGSRRFPAITLPELSKLNQWIAREKKTIQIINQILITMYYGDIQKAKLRNLRKSISFSIPHNLHDKISTQFDIRLFDYK
jgi:hypothetical protein